MPFDDVATLRAALARAEADAARTKAVNADLAARVALLEFQNEKMRRALFGRSSERGRLLVDQLELGFEELARTRRWPRRRQPAPASRRSPDRAHRANRCPPICRASAS